MIRKLLALAAAAVFAAAGCFCAHAETAYREVEVSAPPKMLVLGDSIATGYGLTGYENGRDRCRSYANILKDKYTSELSAVCTFELTNAAVDGYTSGDLLALLKSGQLDDKLSETSCIVISIGGNDMLHALWEMLDKAGITSASEIKGTAVLKMLTSINDLKDKLDENLTAFEKNLTGMTEYISGKSDCPCFVQTLYDPLESFTLVPGLSIVAEEKIGRLNELIRSHASDSGTEYTVCEVAPEFKGKADTLTNIGKVDIHPNSEGHKVIADVVGKAITANKYSYMQPYEAVSAEAADAGAADESVTRLQGGSGSVIAVVCAVCALCAGAAAFIIIKKRKI